MLALFFGIILASLGGLAYLILMLLFFVLAVAATKYEYEIKKELGLYEHERGFENVLFNGIVPVILALLSRQIGPLPFIVSVAAITADKFGSEIGVLDRQKPLFLFGFKEVKPGTSGAVSKVGLFASLLGSTLIGIGATIIFMVSPEKAVQIAIGGFLGSLADSIFGVFEEKGIGTKGTTNLICSIIGGLIGYYI